MYCNIYGSSTSSNMLLYFVLSELHLCKEHEFTCLNGTCVNVTKLCDGKSDCPVVGNGPAQDEDPLECRKFTCLRLTLDRNQWRIQISKKWAG